MFMILSSAIRRLAAVAGVAAAGWAGAALVPAPASPLPTVTVYKSPTCGCCTKWIAHLRSAGFTVVAHDTDDLNGVQSAFGVPFRLGSCHTAKVGNYVIEGHVPADLIQKLLTEQPRVVGLAVPGMVTGSPGMEGPGAEAYDVVAWDRAGKTTVYAHRQP
jgi:hypothetical protein